VTSFRRTRRARAWTDTVPPGRKPQRWEVATRKQIGTSITDPSGTGFFSVAFGQDGKTLATGSADGTTDLWDVAYLADPVSELCESAGRSLTRAEWEQYAPGLAYHQATTRPVFPGIPASIRENNLLGQTDNSAGNPGWRADTVGARRELTARQPDTTATIHLRSLNQV
jgi:hypothetical protein